MEEEDEKSYFYTFQISSKDPVQKSHNKLNNSLDDHRPNVFLPKLECLQAPAYIDRDGTGRWSGL